LDCKSFGVLEPAIELGNESAVFGMLQICAAAAAFVIQFLLLNAKQNQFPKRFTSLSACSLKSFHQNLKLEPLSA